MYQFLSIPIKYDGRINGFRGINGLNWHMCQITRVVLNISYQKRALEGDWLRRLVYIALKVQRIHTSNAISPRFWDFIGN